MRGRGTRDVRRDGSEAPLRARMVLRPCAPTKVSQVTRYVARVLPSLLGVAPSSSQPPLSVLSSLALYAPMN